MFSFFFRAATTHILKTSLSNIGGAAPQPLRPFKRGGATKRRRRTDGKARQDDAAVAGGLSAEMGVYLTIGQRIFRL